MLLELQSNGEFTVASAYRMLQEPNWLDPLQHWKLYGNGQDHNVLDLSFGSWQKTSSSPMELESKGRCQTQKNATGAPDAQKAWIMCCEAAQPLKTAGTKLSQYHRGRHSSPCRSRKWLLGNINPNHNSRHWISFFGTLCCKLWNNRNKNIFCGTHLSPENNHFGQHPLQLFS